MPACSNEETVARETTLGMARFVVGSVRRSLTQSEVTRSEVLYMLPLWRVAIFYISVRVGKGIYLC